MCSASYFLCTLQINSVAAVLLALVVLCTILAVKAALLTDAEWSSVEIDGTRSYLVPPEQPWWGCLGAEWTNAIAIWP